jgi:hypothetical protein
VGFDHDFADLPFADYVNVPPLLGMALSGDMTLIGPLSSVLGLEDLHDIIEVRRIDGHNARLIRKAQEKK